MQISTETFPRCPHVALHLAGGRQDELSLIERVVSALREAKEPMVADAFAVVARDCKTDEDLQILIRCTVTVL